jgi:GH15 family glucan-1,4-alpha-glucosidase
LAETTLARPTSEARWLAERSVELILQNQAPSGAYVASPNFPVYQYCWLRDGAFIADAMSAAGQRESAAAFFDWCRKVMERHTERIVELVGRRHAGEMIAVTDLLHTRYTLDGVEGDDDWPNLQLDGYGAWLSALGAHVTRSGTASEREAFAPSVETTARYLLAFWDHPCYDCWEENPAQVHVSTLAAIHAGLRVSADWPGVASEVQANAISALEQIERRVREEGTRDGHLVKWLGGSELDASLIFCATPYGLFAPDDPLMRATVGALSGDLAHLGVHRHGADDYFGGGEWILLAAALGSHLMAVGDVAGARAQLTWVIRQADEDGYLPEQVSQHLLHPESYRLWVDRWGPVARPLLWSHAMYLNLYGELGLQM